MKRFDIMFTNNVAIQGLEVDTVHYEHDGWIRMTCGDKIMRFNEDNIAYYTVEEIKDE